MLENIPGENVNTEYFHEPCADIPNNYKVFIDGDWVGTVSDGVDLARALRVDRRTQNENSNVDVETSIVVDIAFKEVRVCNDAGRPIRPLLVVAEGGPEAFADAGNPSAWQELLIRQSHCERLQDPDDGFSFANLVDEGLVEYVVAVFAFCVCFLCAPPPCTSNQASKHACVHPGGGGCCC